MKRRDGFFYSMFQAGLMFILIVGLIIIALSFNAQRRNIRMSRVWQHLYLMPPSPTSVPDIALILVSPTPSQGVPFTDSPIPILALEITQLTPITTLNQTATRMPTLTPLPDTATPTLTPTLLRINTSTPLPTPTSTAPLPHTPTPQPTSTPSRSRSPIPTPTSQVDTRLVIPKLGLDAAVVVSPIVGDTWDVSHLEDRVGHLAQTAKPGSSGNVVLAAHVTLNAAGQAGPFSDLDALISGDIVTVFHQGQSFKYQIDQLTTVKSSDIAVSYPSKDSRLTLITCVNYDSNLGRYEDRLVAIGHLASN